jgi:hypothetical protein
MRIVALDVDSGERDPSAYPNPNDYTVQLNDTLYGVTKIRIVEAKVPNSQNLVNTGNKQFQLENQTYVLNEATYINGTDLASNIQTTLVGSNVTSVVFNTKNNKLFFSNVGTSNAFSFKFLSGSNGYSTSSAVGPPAAVFGFNGTDVSSVSGTITSNVIDLSGPTSLFVRITCRGEDFTKDIYINGGTFSFGNTAGQTTTLSGVGPNYIGRIVLGGIGETTYFNTTNYNIEYDVPNLNITDIRLRFYWNNGNKLIPYDFGQRNHILKLEFTCEVDRLSKVYEEGPVDELPPPVEEMPEPFRNNMIVTIALAFILLLGLFILLR